VETTTQLQVIPVDPSDEQAFGRWFAVVQAAERHDRPGEPGQLLHEQRSMCLDGSRPEADTAHVLLGAHDGDGLVGAARLELPQRDNLHLCELELAVHPAARRQGVARALQAEVERLARRRGRTTLLTFADEPPGQEGRSGNRAGAQALGYAVAQQEVRRDIDVPLAAARVEELERSCRPYAAGYAVRGWQDGCPDDLVDDLAELMRQMSTDVPKDEMDWREEVWDRARVRRNEELARAMDRTWIGVGAVHAPTGRMVAFTTMGVPRSQPERAYQWETLVSADHRGHRLGTLVKLAGLRELADRSPRTRCISTWNAQENVPMIAVNDLLGARVNGRLAVLQKVLDR
jgi:GNAT superfamily N-acetyltransferase/RimJ/RimL family protein N-acetyltransferase